MDQIGLDTRAFLDMCSTGHFSCSTEKLGAELEVSGITRKGDPNFHAYLKIPNLNPESFQGEFGSNNVEWNSPVLSFANGAPFTELLEAQVAAIEELKNNFVNALCCGVLPSMRREYYGQYDDHLDLDQMQLALNPNKPRYQLLLDIWKKMYGPKKTIKFPGHSSIKVESCMALSIMSSFQIHYSIRPEDAADALDVAAMISAVTNAPFVSSPRFFSKTGSWEDYRPLFWREIFPNRTGAGPGWANSMEEMLGQLKQYDCIFGIETSQNPLEQLEMGETPSLEALTTHMGCLWFDQRLKIHSNSLTIEERTKGSGTPVDNTAKAVFWTGLMRYFLTQDVPRMRHEFGDFSHTEQNTLRTSEKGLNASICWMGKTTSVRDLILDEFLPMAKLGHADLTSEEVDPFLSIVEKIVLTGRTPAQWIRSRANMYERGGLTFQHTDSQLCCDMLANQSHSIVDWE